MLKKPLFSVVIPAFNAERCIGRSLNSVLCQTEVPVEIIVVDDGSTDDTASVVASFGAGITYLSQPNQGVSVARNHGIAAAQAEWVAFLDADDEWTPMKMQTQRQILSSNPELVWCACNPLSVSGGGVWADASAGIPARKYGPVIDYFKAISVGIPMQTSGFVIRRDVFDEVGVFDPALRVCQDIDLFWRIAMRHRMIGYSPEPLSLYYIDTPDSIMKVSPDRSESLVSVCRNMERARTAGSGVANAFVPFARSLAFDYLLRAATGKITLNPDAVRLVNEVGGLAWCDRALVKLAPRSPGILVKALLRLRRGLSRR